MSPMSVWYSMGRKKTSSGFGVGWVLSFSRPVSHRVFACAGGYIMIASAHMRGMYDLALANVSGAITQNAVLVMPIALIMLAAFSQLGVIAALPNGAVLPIDLETTSVVLLMFPPLLILWKAVKNDGRVSWVESAGMVAVFGLTLYFLAEHG